MKICIIRFSSFGDVVQAMGVLPAIKEKYPDSEIHWVTKSSFAGIVALSPLVDKVHSLDKSGLGALFSLISLLMKEKFQVLYDAHASMRSFVVRNIVGNFLLRFLLDRPKVLVRRKKRIRRIMLFKYRNQTFPWPFKGRLSYLAPLKNIAVDGYHTKPSHWIFPEDVKEKVLSILPKQKFITIAPSAAWEMKRWPLEYWKYLVTELHDFKIIILGGPADTFTEHLEVDPKRVINLSGKLSLVESCYAVFKSHLLICADTGLIHVADVLGAKGISLMGPTAFGHCAGDSIKTMEVELSCRPCTKDGRGGCTQETYQKCMVDIKPEQVCKTAREIVNQ